LFCHSVESSLNTLRTLRHFVVCACFFSFRAARADDAPADSSIPSPKKTKSLKTHSRTRALSDQDEPVTCGKLLLFCTG